MVVELIIGPMFSSKSSTLVERICSHHKRREFKDKNKNIKSIILYGNGTKHKCDTLSRNGASYEHQFINGKNDMDKIIDEYQVIGIDEAQFFPNLKKYVLIMLNKNIDVIIAGLISDFNGIMFQPIIDIIPYTTKIIGKKSSCYICGKSAHFTKKINGNMNQIMDINSCNYQAVCYNHLQ